MHAYLGGCIRTIGGVALEVGGVSDHVHLFAALKPTHCVSEVLRSIKKASSDWARVEIGVSKFHWQDGYSAFTVGRKGAEDLRRYIANQEEHHRTRTFEEEYREFLKARGISFDERFLL
jgi:putative transposase